MDNKQVIVDIPEKLTDYIESLHYEVESRKNLIAFALDHDLSSSASFNKYEDEYKDFFIEYETAKEDMQQRYVIQDYPNFKSWNLDFNKSQLIIELK